MGRRGGRPSPHLRSARHSATFAFFIYGCVVGSWVSRLPTIKHHLGLNSAQLGIALVGSPVGLIVAVRFAPLLVNRFTSAVATRAAAAAACLSMVSLALAPSFAALFALLVPFGLCLGIFDVSMNTQGVAIEHGYGRPIMVAFHGSYSVGVLTGALCGAIAAQLGLAPVTHFSLAAGGLLVIDALATRALLPAEADLARAEHADTLSAGQTAEAATAARRALIAIGLVAFCSFFAEGAVADWSGVYLHEVQHASFAIAPLGAAACGAGQAIGRLIGDRFIARYGRMTLLWRTALIAMVGMSLAVLAPTLGVAIAGYALLGLGTATIVPMAFTLAGRVPGVRPATALARVTTLGYVALFGSPTVIGLIADGVGLGASLWVPAILLMLIVPLSRLINEGPVQAT